MVFELSALQLGGRSERQQVFVLLIVLCSALMAASQLAVSGELIALW